MDTKNTAILSRLLLSMGISHTQQWTDNTYASMPLKTFFGLHNTLKEYNIDSCAYKVSNKGTLFTIPTPYLAQTTDGKILIVESIGKTGIIANNEVGNQTLTPDEFKNICTGTVMGVYPNSHSIEPDYMAHSISQVGNRLKTPLLIVSLLTLWIYAAITGGVWKSAGGICLTIVYALGLYISYLLVLKQLNIHSHIAERVCGVIEKQGCSTVLKTKGASFFGIFHWCEVGVTYFGISLVALTLKPDWIPQLALINVCCLPFSLWSVWYQHYRAKAWCTLCLSVQALLWLQFFTDLICGNFRAGFPISASIIILGLCYMAGLLIINKILSPYEKDNESD